MRWFVPASFVLLLASLGPTARAAYILQIDTDGSVTGDYNADPSLIMFHPNFSFGGDTTDSSDSVASLAVGMTGGDSLFGGNGTSDTFVYKYTPGIDGDNLVLAAGTALNDNGDVASGVPAGGTTQYRIYATWPRTLNVSGGMTNYTLSDGMTTLFTRMLDQNTINDNSIDGDRNTPDLGGGDEWVLLGTALLNAGTTYTLTQTPTTDGFVSMRSAGILIDPVPEPASLLVGAMGIGFVTLFTRRSKSTH
jgi:hypothetical protein